MAEWSNPEVLGSSPALTTILFHGRPGFNFSATLVNSFRQLGILAYYVQFMFSLFLRFKCSAPQAPCYIHFPRVNKEQLFIYLVNLSSMNKNSVFFLVASLIKRNKIWVPTGTPVGPH